MPYLNIVFVKIKMRLLEDDRFLIDLNDTQKALYLLMLALAGKTGNKTRDDERYIMGRLGLQKFDRSDLVRISEVFDKFKLTEGYWTFEDFDNEHNYTYRENPKQESGKPKTEKGFSQNKKENKKENKELELRTKDIGADAPTKQHQEATPKDLKSVQDYMTELGYQNEAENFFDYFSANGWKVGGKTPMKNWQAACRNWVRRSVKINKDDTKKNLTKGQQRTLESYARFKQAREYEKTTGRSSLFMGDADAPSSLSTEGI